MKPPLPTSGEIAYAWAPLSVASQPSSLGLLGLLDLMVATHREHERQTLTPEFPPT